MAVEVVYRVPEKIFILLSNLLQLKEANFLSFGARQNLDLSKNLLNGEERDLDVSVSKLPIKSERLAWCTMSYFQTR